MKWQIPIKLDSKNRITLPKEISKKIVNDSDLIVEYDQGLPNVIHIVIIKKENEDTLMNELKKEVTELKLKLYEVYKAALEALGEEGIEGVEEYLNHVHELQQRSWKEPEQKTEPLYILKNKK